MERRQWKATWYDAKLNHHEYTFYAPDNYFIAGIDFRLSLMSRGQRVPESFELEEGNEVVRVVPSLRDLVERGELR